METQEIVYREISEVCKAMCKAEPTRLRIAENEKDDSIEQDLEASEFLKIREKRCGRDFKLYGFMATVSSQETAFADFAQVLIAVKTQAPEAFAAVKTKVESWNEFFQEKQRGEWIGLWS